MDNCLLTPFSSDVNIDVHLLRGKKTVAYNTWESG